MQAEEAYNPFMYALARLLISISGRRLWIVPIIIHVRIEPLNWRLRIAAVAALFLIIAVSRMPRAMYQELFTSFTTYAVGLVVFFVNLLNYHGICSSLNSMCDQVLALLLSLR